MAPITLSTVDNEIKDIIQHLFEIQSAVHGYLGPETQQELVRKIKNLTASLHTLSIHTSDDPSSTDPSNPHSTSTNNANANINPSDPPITSIALPPEIIDYVDAARNPDIYTREFVELVQRGNQDLKGKKEAFASFRDVLAREMRGAMPEVRGEVERVIRATGGEREDQR
ncbi:Putative Mediator of RNA polymerase II transcription subunit 10 [Aspergillus calidoustus]|uniref:Mediator of RNA polymerase II transcription subunit 10 n=1 Tax=Aspergillus calidoustus TaxID=454130 RepID=A0A0U5GQB2_ASPCI|nr:Putative Mediator of RNA polymerase II transcription subunit 10 [Aspergillus calidoustus]